MIMALPTAIPQSNSNEKSADGSQSGTPVSPTADPQSGTPVSSVTGPTADPESSFPLSSAGLPSNVGRIPKTNNGPTNRKSAINPSIATTPSLVKANMAAIVGQRPTVSRPAPGHVES